MQILIGSPFSSPIVECVPNFSEGRDTAAIEAIARSISGVEGVSLLGVEPGADANRSVYTFLGPPHAVVGAAVAAARTAFPLIDMAQHSGAHPRIGALDVCPFVPVSGIDLEACVELAKEAAARIAEELGVPVYLYEAAASRPQRRSLAYIRSGGYEALRAKLLSREWAPDYGPAAFVPRWGATVVGARAFLIAYNLNLNTRDTRLAEEIAKNIRESGRLARDSRGYPIKDGEGKAIRISGRLKAVRAIGWYIDAYGRAQVSVNLLDYETTPLHLVFETVEEEAQKLGLRVEGGEIVGLVPLDPILRAGRRLLEKELAGEAALAGEAELVKAAIRYLGLDSVAPFDPGRKILEYAAIRGA
jgi:glutamate formiminotransferase / formiminotetrahydrofolate cyclodeaminase